MEFFKAAAKQGHIGAINWVAFGLINKHAKRGKRGAVEDIAEAVGLLQEGISHGLLEAKFDMANLLVDGSEGCVKDEKQAFDYYKDLAELSYLPAMINLGQCYENGTGMRNPNLSLAFAYYKRAADMGDINGQCNAGVMHCLGSGVEADKELGRKYFRKAIAQGCKEAQNLLQGSFDEA
jgi:TPR repeat protein